MTELRLRGQGADEVMESQVLDPSGDSRHFRSELGCPGDMKDVPVFNQWASWIVQEFLRVSEVL